MSAGDAAEALQQIQGSGTGELDKKLDGVEDSVMSALKVLKDGQFQLYENEEIDEELVLWKSYLEKGVGVRTAAGQKFSRDALEGGQS